MTPIQTIRGLRIPLPAPPSFTPHAGVAGACGASGSPCGPTSHFMVDAANAMLVAIDSAISHAAWWLLVEVGRTVSSSSEPPLGSPGFLGHLGVMYEIAGLFILPLVLAAVIHATVRQDLWGVVRVVVVQLPLAVLLGAVAGGTVRLVVRATDAMTADFVSATGFSAPHTLGGIGLGLLEVPTGVPAMVGVILATLMIASTVILWVELIVRSGAIVAGTLFMPLALAGLVWPVTAVWSRRLAETLFALIMSKLAIVVLLATGASLVAGAHGVAGVTAGAALVLVASFAPFALLRLVPMVEAGAIGHFDGLGRRGLSRSLSLGFAAADGVAGLALGTPGVDGGTEGGQPPLAVGEPPDQAYLDLFGPGGPWDTGRGDPGPGGGADGRPLGGEPGGIVPPGPGGASQAGMGDPQGPGVDWWSEEP